MLPLARLRSHSTTYQEVVTRKDRTKPTVRAPALKQNPGCRLRQLDYTGEVITAELLGRRPQYFRYPFLHTGDTKESKDAVQNFVAKHGYKNAPVTLDNNDYLFAVYYAKMLASHNLRQAEHIREEYVSYMESIFEFFEKRSAEVTGHEIRQILLVHANQLNADAIPELLAMMRRREYTIVSLTRALDEPAYSLSDSYVGTRGLSWIHR
jgi:peptidoglycan/xylan/chitin deacetylase (PgdA/CDA1 family)